MTVKKIHIKKISEIDNEKLLQFYQNSFNYEKPLLDNYNWRYRIDFNRFEPLVLLIDDQIHGHAGLIPIKLKVNNVEKEAIWFTDFYISPKYRSKGYGKLLTKEWMKICPTQITICNDKSLNIFNKFNWKSNNKFIRRAKINSYFKILPLFGKKNHNNFFKNNVDNLKHIELNNSLVEKIIKFNDQKMSKNSTFIVRDESWFKWRLIDCPYKNKINIFKYKENYFITHLRQKKNLKILNIIYSTTSISHDVGKIFLEFSKKNNIDFFTFVSNEKKLLDNFLPWQRKLNFAFYSNDNNVTNDLNNKLNDIQMIDSDIDYV